MNTKPTLDDLFERRLNFPDPVARQRLAALVGLDDHKQRLMKILGVLINPDGVNRRGVRRRSER
jgi:hypothetical protein